MITVDLDSIMSIIDPVYKTQFLMGHELCWDRPKGLMRPFKVVL